jgi:hypothetical protein
VGILGEVGGAAADRLKIGSAWRGFNASSRGRRSPRVPRARLERIAGAANELPQAILVNPNDPDALVGGIEQGLTVPHEETSERWAAMFEYLSRHDIGAWRRGFPAALM